MLSPATRLMASATSEGISYDPVVATYFEEEKQNEDEESHIG